MQKDERRHLNKCAALASAEETLRRAEMELNTAGVQHPRVVKALEHRVMEARARRDAAYFAD